MGRLRGTVSFHPCGATLFDTLLLHAVPADGAPFTEVGLPEWEQTPRPAATDPIRQPSTLLEQLTGRWEKTAWLHQTDRTVDRVTIATGRRRPDTVTEADPYAALKRIEDKETKQPITVPLRSRPGRAIWRDFPLTAGTGRHRTPRDAHSARSAKRAQPEPRWDRRMGGRGAPTRQRQRQRMGPFQRRPQDAARPRDRRRRRPLRAPNGGHRQAAAQAHTQLPVGRRLRSIAPKKQVASR